MRILLICLLILPFYCKGQYIEHKYDFRIGIYADYTLLNVSGQNPYIAIYKFADTRDFMTRLSPNFEIALTRNIKKRSAIDFSLSYQSTKSLYSVIINGQRDVSTNRQFYNLMPGIVYRYKFKITPRYFWDAGAGLCLVHSELKTEYSGGYDLSPAIGDTTYQHSIRSYSYRVIPAFYPCAEISYNMRLKNHFLGIRLYGQTGNKLFTEDTDNILVIAPNHTTQYHYSIKDYGRFIALGMQFEI